MTHDECQFKPHYFLCVHCCIIRCIFSHCAPARCDGQFVMHLVHCDTPTHHECQFVIDKDMKIGYHVKVDIAVIP